MILEPDKRNMVMPLPVVLISTISKEGIRNAAPWSCVMPILRPLDLVIIASWLKRDTLDNIRQTGEFVINVPPAEMAGRAMVCARNYPPEVDEFEMAGLKPRPSANVKPPGIEGCLAWAECVLNEESRQSSSWLSWNPVRTELPFISLCNSILSIERAFPLP
jgi:flavin reductase (DIM6/NTAB) family NADH-FMN oxidoreductase RutF